MPTLRWEGDSRFTDNRRDFVARPNTEHDLSDEQADVYQSHALFGDQWVAVEGEGETDAEAQDEREPAESDSGGQSSDESDMESETGSEDDFTMLDGVGDATAEHLCEAGYETVDDLRNASVDDLTSVESITESKAESIADQVQNEA